MKCIIDIETNGLIDFQERKYPSKLWCIVLRDIDTDQVYRYAPGHLSSHQLKEKCNEVDLFIAHNGIHFDFPVLKQLLGIDIPLEKIHDTLIMSRLYDPVRKAGHSLKSWGIELECGKWDFTDFHEYSEEMLEYCVQDTEVTKKLYFHLERLMKSFSNMSKKIEHGQEAILFQQKWGGFAFDVCHAQQLMATCLAQADRIELEIHKSFPPLPVFIREYTPCLTQKGEMSRRSCGPLDTDELELDAPYSLIRWQEFNLGSPKQKVERLEGHWSPFEKTKSGESWKTSEENLDTIHDDAPDAIKKLHKWTILNNRATALGGWLDNVGRDDCVHGTVISNGASTHRSAHRSPNTANIPAARDRRGRVSLYGEECRALWTVRDPKKYVLLGTDAAGIQLRILAHYIAHPDYIDTVIHGNKDDGTDIHSMNKKRLGSVCGSREVSKTFIYAFLLGAAVPKLASILSCTSALAGQANKNFITETPGLKRLLLKKDMIADRGWLKGLDGRIVNIPSRHLALAMMLQAGEAVVMKLANILWHKEATEKQIDFRQAAFVHDEWQTEVEKDRVDELGEIQVRSLVKAGEILGLNCPMNGAYDYGANWAETH